MARSPNYPAHGLREAIELIRQVYDKEKRTVLSGHDIAGALGYSGLSGNARSKIASLKKFDLLDGDETKGMRVSELAVHFLYPASEVEALEAKRKAALAPDLFKHLYEEKRDGSDESIKNYLVSRMDFTPSGAAQAIESFKETLEFAGLNGIGYNAFNTPDGVEAHPLQTDATSASNISNPALDALFKDFAAKPNPASHEVNAWTWTLSMPRSVKADLRIVGKVTKADVVRLKKQIEALEEA